MDIQKMMQQAKQMQQDAKRIQKELANTDIEGSAGGKVTVTVTGAKKLKAITIAPEAAEGDVKTLEGLVLKAVNDALSKADSLAEREMKKATGGLGGLL